MTQAQIAQFNEGFYSSKMTVAESNNGDLMFCCIVAAEAGRVSQVNELVRHFNSKSGDYAAQCVSDVNEWLEINS